MYMGLFYLSIQLLYVFWLEHLIHLHLRSLLIGTYSLQFYFLCTCVLLSFTLFLHLLKTVPFTYLAVLVWWRFILWAFFCLGNSLFFLHFHWEHCWMEKSWFQAFVFCYLQYFFFFKLINLFLFSYNCLHFIPIPPPHPRQSHLPLPLLPSPLILSLCPL